MVNQFTTLFDLIKYHIINIPINFRIFFLLCVIPILQVFLHCIYYGRYPDTLHIAIYNQETNCTHNPCEYIEKCSYYSCHFLHFFHNTTNFKLVSY